MFKDFIKQQADVDIYPLISLVLFTIFFGALLIRTFMLKKDFVREMSALPIEDESQSAVESQKPHEK